VEIRPRKASAKGPAEQFTGDVWIDPIAQGSERSAAYIASVHFAPGAHTAWHSHSGGQTLYVTEGQGRVQGRGETVQEIRAGDVVYTPPDQWHWHGAAPDHFLTHMSLTEGDAHWGEHVTDAEYGDPTVS
jgi:quercetin dioxygenase-like cupin family protein